MQHPLGAFFNSSHRHRVLTRLDRVENVLLASTGVPLVFRAGEEAPRFLLYTTEDRTDALLPSSDADSYLQLTASEEDGYLRV